MVDVRRAGPGDAEELMRLRGVMMGVAEVGGDWQRAGAEILRTQLVAAERTIAAFVADKGDEPGLAACVLGQVDQRLPGPNSLTGLRGYVRRGLEWRLACGGGRDVGVAVGAVGGRSVVG